MRKKRIVKLIVPILCIAACFMAGCGSREHVELAYDVYQTTDHYLDGLKGEDGKEVSFFAEELCVGGQENSLSEEISSDNAESAAVFCIDDREITYSKNIYEKRYPASTTKILTAYLALKYGDPDQMLTVSDYAIDSLDPSSSVCGLKKGDQLSLNDALYGLMLPSGNDAANVIAEGISGSIEAFADLMNREAYAMGATDSHFVNPSGLPDPDHFTTAYDLYLIFNEAIRNEAFVDLISTKTYEASYQDQSGGTIVKNWNNTNWYLAGTYEQPEGIHVVGGKTGTTDEAGHCLVLYSKNSAGDSVISVVLKGKSKRALYQLMTEMLTNFSN